MSQPPNKRSYPNPINDGKQAALFGAGCWAQDTTEDTDGFACSLTGAGEQITKTLLARTCMETCLLHDDLSEAAHEVLDRFMKNPLLKAYTDKHAGWIGVRVDRESGGGRAELVFAHTTQTMVSFSEGRVLLSLTFFLDWLLCFCEDLLLIHSCASHFCGR